MVAKKAKQHHGRLKLSALVKEQAGLPQTGTG
jgi:hypothetical protein